MKPLKQFNFIFNRLKQPLKLTFLDKSTKEVNEPIINNANPNLTFVNQAGGQIGTGTLIWVSKLENVERGTLVTVPNGITYKVISDGQDIIAGLFYYQLEFNTTSKGGDDIGDY